MFRTAASNLREWQTFERLPSWPVGVTVFVLLLSLGLALTMSGGGLTLVLVALLVLMGGRLILAYPPFGLVLLVIASFAVPLEISTGTLTRINAAVVMVALLLAAWVLKAISVRGGVGLISSRTLTPLLAFLVVSLLSAGFGQLPWYAPIAGAPIRAQLGGLGLIFLSAGTFLIASHQIRNPVWLRAITWVFIGFGAFIVAGRVVPDLGTFVDEAIQSRATGSLFWTWLVALAFGQLATNAELNTRWRAGLAALVVATLVVSLGGNPGWTSGWLPPLVSILVITLLAWPRTLFVLVPIAGVGALLRFQDISDFILIGGNRYSLLTRLEAWQILGEVAAVNPLLGLGPANYFWYTPLFPILGWSVNYNSHNNFVDIFAQTGLIGLLLLLWFLFEIGRVGWRLTSEAPSGFSKAFAYSALGGLAGTIVAAMLGDWFLPFVYNVGFSGFRASMFGWLFLGGLIALEQMSKRGVLSSKVGLALK